MKTHCILREQENINFIIFLEPDKYLCWKKKKTGAFFNIIYVYELKVGLEIVKKTNKAINLKQNKTTIKQGRRKRELIKKIFVASRIENSV